MKSNLKFFKNSKYLPVDEFIRKVLYDKKFGYYSTKNPIGMKGDFITAPHISKIFSEIISIWIISCWEKFDKPKILNIVELGPGDGSFAKTFIETSKKFPKFNSAKRVYLYETSKILKEIQKSKIKSKQVKWIKNFSGIKKNPTIFFGNEFFDAIPIKQFKRNQNTLYEKHYYLEKNYKIKEIFKKASTADKSKINSFKTLQDLKFIEYPKFGLKELSKVTKILSKLGGCVLMIDYGYLKPNNQNTLQSIMNNKKNMLLNNLGNADITSHVNFALLKEFFLKNGFKIEKIVSQRDFLVEMGIMKRAEILAKRMKFKDQTNLYLRLRRLLSPKLMGNLFKVFLAHKHKNKFFFGFN